MINPVGLFGMRMVGADGGDTASSSVSQAATAGAASFGDLLAAAVDRGFGTLQQAETMSVRALQGDADTREVADAVMSAEQSLQAAIAIRDKLVSAYLDISRMAI
jgi:flagellar hook-basal body complex protein FliE